MNPTHFTVLLAVLCVFASGCQHVDTQRPIRQTKEPKPTVTRSYTVNSNVLAELGAAAGGTNSQQLRLEHSVLRRYFAEHNIPLEPPASFFLNDRDGRLIVREQLENQKRLARLVIKMNKARPGTIKWPAPNPNEYTRSHNLPRVLNPGEAGPMQQYQSRWQGYSASPNTAAPPALYPSRVQQIISNP